MNATDFKIAVVVDPSLPLGFLANTVATISIGVGAAQPGFGNTTLTDIQGRFVKNSADRPVPILQSSDEGLRALLLKALPAPEDAIIIPFPRFARSLHSFAHYQTEFPTRDLAGEPLDGLGIAGPSAWVKSLTGSLKLLR